MGAAASTAKRRKADEDKALMAITPAHSSEGRGEADTSIKHRRSESEAAGTGILSTIRGLFRTSRHTAHGCSPQDAQRRVSDGVVRPHASDGVGENAPSQTRSRHQPSNRNVDDKALKSTSKRDLRRRASQGPHVLPAEHSQKCLSCLRELCVVALSPCGHLCLCTGCPRPRKCPICRSPVKISHHNAPNQQTRSDTQSLSVGWRCNALFDSSRRCGANGRGVSGASSEAAHSWCCLAAA